MKTYRELIEEERGKFIGKKVEYRGKVYTVCDVDYNGSLMIDKPARFTKTTAIYRFDRDLTILD